MISSNSSFIQFYKKLDDAIVTNDPNAEITAGELIAKLDPLTRDHSIPSKQFIILSKK
jgi:hypothetical protein